MPWFDFDKFCEWYEAATPEWCRKVFEEAISLFARWDNWKISDSPELTASLICCTWIQTVWDWRPQVAITGPTTSGKSMLVDKTIGNLFGALKFVTADTTEAGIRAFIGHTAKAIILDEFEDSKKRQAVLTLFRTSSRGTAIARSSSSQKGVTYGLRHIPWVAAIETGMSRSADRNRYIMLELDKVEKRPGRQPLTLESPEKLTELGQKLMIVSIKHWKAAKSLTESLRIKSFPDVDHRIVESFSVPCGMLGAVLGVTVDEAAGVMETMLAKRDFVAQQEGDEDALIAAIYQSEVYLRGGERKTVGQLLASKSYEAGGGEETPQDALVRSGIKRVYPNEFLPQKLPHLFFVQTAIKRGILKDAPDFRNLDISQILLRISTTGDDGVDLLATIARLFWCKFIGRADQESNGLFMNAPTTVVRLRARGGDANRQMRHLGIIEISPPGSG